MRALPDTLPDPSQTPYRLDATVELKEPEKGIDWLAWIQASTPIVIALVGLYFTDTVRVGLERQQLQLANASGMQSLLTTLLGAQVSQNDARAAASTLAAFGPPAVAPLITALSDADDVRTPAIEGALRAIGLNYPEAVCVPLINILQRQAGRFSWLMHRSAIRVIGDVRCPAARSLLQTYKERVTKGELKTYNAATDAMDRLTPENAELLTADLDRALENTVN
jgi:HEAT repeat protein